MTTQPGQWMTIREAALVLNVSELTIRRRIKDGRLASRLDNGKYYVNRSAPSPVAPPSAPTPMQPFADAPSDPDRARPRTSVTEQHLERILPEFGRLAEQAGRASVLESNVSRLEEECRALRDSLVALSGRNGWLESKLEEREQELKLLTDNERKPSFWRRIFG